MPEQFEKDGPEGGLNKEIDRIFERITEASGENSLLEDLQGEVDKALSGTETGLEIISPEEIDKHEELCEEIRRVIKQVDFVQRFFIAVKASIYRGRDGVWLVDRPEQKTVTLSEMLDVLRETLRTMALARKMQVQNGGKNLPDLPIE